MKTQKRKIMTLWTMLLLVFGIGSSQLFAGSGTINVPEKTIDLNVFFTYQETDEKLEGSINPSWKKVFNDASKRLWNATNGQLRIGKVTVYLRALSRKDDGDAWIGRGNKTAYATGYGKMGEANHHMMFYSNTHRSLNAAYQGDLSIVHEMGHYVFGLVDQYIGAKVPIAKKDTWTVADLQGAAGTPLNGNLFQKTDYICSVAHNHAQKNNTSIMDAGGGVNNTRTEFDTAGNTNKGRSDGTFWYMQGHYIVNKESCWESLGKFKWNGVNVFPTVPAGDSPTGMPAGFQDIEFKVVPTLYRLALCIDRSGSMSLENRMTMAKQGASIFTNLLQPKHEIKMFAGTPNEEIITVDGDTLSVVSFNNGTIANLPMAEVDKDGNLKTQARTTISTLYPSGTTAIGEGVQQSLTQISGQGDKVSGEVIILLSDGYNNSGATSPADAANNAKARGAKIYSIGLGGADSATLGSMAAVTGGKYYHASNALGLLSIYPSIYSELKGGGLVEAISSLLHEKSSESQTVRVEENTEEVTFAVTSPDEGWSFSITSPSGVDYSKADESAGVSFEDNKSELHYRVSAPEAGEWSLQVKAPESASDTTYQYNLIVSSSNAEVSVKAESDKQIYTYPEKALIKCNVIAKDPVAGADVSAVVSGPDGVVGTLKLYDDGLDEHGDEFPNDGTYSGYFGRFTGNGLYTFDINVIGKDIKQAIAIPEKHNGADFEPEKLPDFNRHTSVTIEAKDVPDVNIGWLRVDAMQLGINRKDPSSASLKMAFTLNSPTQSFVPGKNDLTITINNSVIATIPATAFSKAGKKGDVYRIKDKVNGISGILRHSIGGSSLSQAVVKLRRVANSLILPRNNATIRVEIGGVDESVQLGVSSNERKMTYNSKKNYSLSQILYIDALQIKKDSNKENKDSLRLVATFSGGANYNPAWNDVVLRIGQYELKIPAGSLKANKNGSVVKGKIEVANPDGSKAKVVVNIRMDKAIITIRASKLDIAESLQDMEICSLEIGSFKKANLLSFSIEEKKGKKSIRF